MSPTRTDLLTDLVDYVRSHGVDVRRKDMDVEKPGEFDGPTLTINPKHDREALSFYAAHALGSIYQWSTDFEHSRKVFDSLRDAKNEGGPSGPRFEEALERWRQFEATSSDHAVWTLRHIGYGEAVPPYTVFFRADIEAMTIFHRTGKEPRWPDFFAEWKEKVSRGEIRVEPFRPRPIEPFKPVKIEKQEVLQEHD
jgi:hypothetical protein